MTVPNNPGKPLEGAFTLLGKTFGLYKDNFKTLIGYAAWLLVPYAVYLIMAILEPEMFQAYSLQDPDAMTTFSPLATILVIIASIAGIVAGIWVTNALTQFVSKVGKKEKVDHDKIKQRSWQLFIPVIWVGILTALIVGAGLFVLLIPGIIFAIYLAFASVSVILDNQRGTKALSYSYELIKGRFWRTLWRLIVGVVVLLVIYFLILGVLAGIVLAVDVATGGTIDNMSLSIILILDTIDQLMGVAFTPLFLAYTVLLYHNMKATR